MLLALLAFHCLLNSMGGLVRADEDEVEEEEEEGVVEEEAAAGGADAGSDTEEGAGTGRDKTTSPDADTTILFTRPPGTTSLGKAVHWDGGWREIEQTKVVDPHAVPTNLV